MNQIIKKEVTMGQLITVGFTLATLIIGGWINMSLEMQSVKIKINYLENDRSMTVQRFEKLDAKMDKILEELNCIKVDMKGKVDK